jgi:hypothetical protein
VKGREDSQVAFEELDASVDKHLSQDWVEEERKAMQFRGDYLRIYEVQTNKGLCFIYCPFYQHANMVTLLKPLPWVISVLNSPKMKTKWVLPQGLLPGSTKASI